VRDTRAFAAAVAGAVCLAVYAATLSSACWVGDSGELAADAAVLGIAHPPGYPLYTLLGRVLLVAFPAKPALVLNLFSAATGALSAALVALLIMEMGAGWSAALAGGLLHGAARTLWSQSVVTEVYALHMMLALLAFLLVLRYRRLGAPPQAVAACWVAGLGLAHHTSMALLMPAFAILLGSALRLNRSSAALAAGCVCATLLALTLYLYLPLRSRVGPPNNWGHPATLRALWDHISGRLYARQIAVLGGSLGTNAGLLFRSLLQQWSAPVLALPVVGLALTAIRHPKRLLLLAVATLPVLAFGLAYRIPDIEPQFVPLWTAAVVGSVPVLALAERRRWGRLLLPGLAVIPLVYNYGAVARSTCRFPEHYARTVLRTAPHGATVLCQGQLTPLLAYLHQAEQVRPDMVLVDRLGNLFSDPYHYRTATTPPDIHRASVEKTMLERKCELFYLLQPQRPIQVQPCGLLFRATADGEEGRCTLLPSSPLRDPPPGCLAEPIVRELAGQYHLNLATWAYLHGRVGQAESHLAACERVGERSPQVLSALANYYQETGETKKAASLYRRALSLDRRFLPAAVNLARIEPAEAEYVLGYMDQAAHTNPGALAALARAWLDSGKPSEAEKIARRLLRREPHNCDAELILGNSLLERGNHHEAERAYRRAVSTCPALADAWANLCMIHGSKGEMAEAVEAGQKAMDLEPTNLAALNNLATTYALTGDIDNAKDLWRRSLKIDPSQDRIRAYLESAPGS
jgi:tetratricopeptide (TPR) repeat protein